MPRLYRACARPRSSSCTAPSSSGGGDCDDRGECGSATEDVAPVAMKVGSRDRSNGYSFRCACVGNGLDRVHNCCVSSVDNNKIVHTFVLTVLLVHCQRLASESYTLIKTLAMVQMKLLSLMKNCFNGHIRHPPFIPISPLLLMIHYPFHGHTLSLLHQLSSPLQDHS